MDDKDRYRRGWERLEEMDPGAASELTDRLNDIAPDLARYIMEFPFGSIYTRPGLDWKSRELAVVAALTALGSAASQLKEHLHRALRAGWTRQELVEVIMQMSVYAGVPAALNAMAVAKEVFKKQDESGKP
jgi:4-carboxymuconolactone decarboxylase